MGESAIVEGRWTVSPGLGLGMFIIRTFGGERIAVTRSKEVAHLIAAAPEILAALNEAENALADYVPTLERSGAHMGYGNSVLAQVRAAILKAKHHGG